ncbi:tetratricopeptide repeat (TPR)-like superfamily protein [Actinidia rufa]|uniref:Tetratricopeptide repeat (TPR)-like superfamily protein n=1 Tax=Actinidia rufa TaxID=165716 RepID=A0A7J0H2N7_9ERIC|nr:tetratricopeptide repeat (TPR)-like superfamily protein [Actinidia rufa]
MVLIESTPSEKESSRRVNLTPEPKSKPSASNQGGTSEAGDASDGFETASDGEFNVVDDNGDEHQHQRQQQEQTQSSAATDESLEAASCDESTEKALEEANDAKLEGNRLFGAAQYEEALSQYGLALQVAPDMPSSVEIRSMCHANRALCFLKLGKYEDTIKDCTKALELNPNYVKALLRRGEAHEKLEHFEEAVADLKKVVELDPSDVQARRTIQRLEPLAAEKREKMKQEMISKLKDMGNSILGRFGMSVDNFKAVQDPTTGSYSISFQKFENDSSQTSGTKPRGELYFSELSSSLCNGPREKQKQEKGP